MWCLYTAGEMSTVGEVSTAGEVSITGEVSTAGEVSTTGEMSSEVTEDETVVPVSNGPSVSESFLISIQTVYSSSAMSYPLSNCS